MLEELRRQVRARQALPAPHVCQAIRVAAGVSRARVGEEVGVGEASIRFYEKGERTPRGEHLEKYIAVLDALREETLR